ncbi:hypothetical protein E2C01_053074 [Portunus trituberculatus]|uniref:Uncharacterized protein n=1 Tax=Portunus trituberculatus TaxID=210409 RepID=A0A5B7GN78_PORTR|nr:hypothetical protein [Portunus trituberculatus]
MSSLALASVDKNSKTFYSMLKAVPAHVAKTWSVQETMSAMESHFLNLRQQAGGDRGRWVAHRP